MECGAGLGLVLILRWYWWRINAWTEIAATLAPFIGYALARYGLEWVFPNSFFFTVGFTTLAWLATMLLTKPEPIDKLRHFYNLIKPDGWWNFEPKSDLAADDSTKSSGNILNLTVSWITAVFFTYSILFLIGKFLLQEWAEAGWSFAAAAVSLLLFLRFLSRTRIFK